MMRSAERIVVLLRKEWRRLTRNAPAMLMIGLVLIIALLIAVDRSFEAAKASAAETANASRPACQVVFDAPIPWYRHLQGQKKSPPISLGQSGRETGACEVLVSVKRQDQNLKVAFTYHYPPQAKAEIQKLSDWLWRQAALFYSDKVRYSETHQVQQPEAQAGEQIAAGAGRPSLPGIEEQSDAMLNALMLFSIQFFICCALLVSLGSAERERGVLQAIALSPATAAELVWSKFLFHGAVAVAVCLVLARVLSPELLSVPGFWLALGLTCVGWSAVAMCIVSIAERQTTASLLSFAYLVIGGTVMYLGKKFPAFDALQQFSFEYYAMPIYFLSMTDDTQSLLLALRHGLPRMTLLILVWCALAVFLFKRRGWQR